MEILYIDCCVYFTLQTCFILQIFTATCARSAGAVASGSSRGGQPDSLARHSVRAVARAAAERRPALGGGGDVHRERVRASAGESGVERTARRRVPCACESAPLSPRHADGAGPLAPREAHHGPGTRRHRAA